MVPCLVKKRDRELIPPPGERHPVLLREPCDFAGDVLPTLQKDVWPFLDEEQRATLAAIFARYGLRVRRALRGVLRDFIPKNVAAAAGVTPSAVGKWKRAYPALRADFETVAGLLPALQAEKQAHHEARRAKRAAKKRG